MNRFALVLLFAMLQACSAKVVPPLPDPASLRETGSGAVVGFADRFDTWSWRGIPIAAPPVGELRWRAPQPFKPWEGDLEAVRFGSMCPQLPIPIVNDTDEPWLGDEDCLYLNVSAPRSWSPGDPALPVMLWIHGGGNTVGSADLYSAVRNLAAREDVVVVSIHYRLGVFGWFSHPALRELAVDELDASGNFGTLDTIAALNWVEENIHAFGGDADNVTVFGESAGGFNTFALLLSPMADGLFHRAIIQSGMLLTTSRDLAENTVDAREPGHKNGSSELLLRLLQADGTAANREQAQQLLAGWDSGRIMAYLRSRTPRQLLENMQDREEGLYSIPNMLRDGVVLPEGEPLDLLARGEFNRVPVIMGTNRDEMKTMMIRNPNYTKLRLGLIPAVRDQALYDRVTGYGSAMWKAIGADEPAAAMVQSGHKEVYVYRFDWDEMPSNWLLDFKGLMGAGHSLEIPFVFDDMDNEMTYMPIDQIDEDNLEQAVPLARAMSSYWGEFAHRGEPGSGRQGKQTDWLPWRGQGRFLVLDVASEGGIRMERGSLDRAGILGELARDANQLGGREGICVAYDSMFGEDQIFSFVVACESAEECVGDRGLFCSSSGGIGKLTPPGQ